LWISKKGKDEEELPKGTYAVVAGLDVTAQTATELGTGCVVRPHRPSLVSF
jgi:hypothetical protein